MPSRHREGTGHCLSYGMDLRTAYPRSPRVHLGAYVHLARMIDKCRASLAGTQGDYIFPCPMDQCLLDFTGITVQQFTEAVSAHSSDEAVVYWFLSAATPHSASAIEAWNRQFLALAPDTPEKVASFKRLRDAIDPSRTEVTTWADLLDLEEGRLSSRPARPR